MPESFAYSFKKMFSLIISVFLIVCILFITGCQKKEEKPIQQSPVVADTTKKIINEIPDIKGKYSGIFDNHSTSLNIREQEGIKFKGSITINYRQVINQQISGEFDPKALTFSMTDLLHSRFQGKYSGKFSEDRSKMAGNFTMNLDGSKFSFKLTKK
jgi:PBP1b-binding outer membrane lipoprotein LpoB